MYSLVTAALSSRSWYRTWNSSAYHHWDPKQTVSYKFFFLFFFGGFRYRCCKQGHRRGRSFRGERSCTQLRSSERVNSLRRLFCIWLFTLRNIICKNEKYTHTHTHAQRADMINSDGKGKKKDEVCCYGTFLFHYYWHAKTPKPLWIVKDSGSDSPGSAGLSFISTFYP